MGPEPSRGAYLLSSSSTTKTSGREVPSDSLSSNMRFRTAPTTKRLARSCRAWMSTTLSWRRRQSRRWSSRLPTSRAPDQVAHVAGGRVQAPLEGGHRAGGGGRRPDLGQRASPSARRRSVKTSTKASKLSMRLALDGDPGVGRLALARGRPAAWPRCGPPRSRAGSRLSSASANRKRSSRSFTNSRSVQKKAWTPSWRLPVAGSRSRSRGARGPGAGRCRRAPAAARASRRPRGLRRAALVGLVEEQQVLALHVEDRARGWSRPRAPRAPLVKRLCSRKVA